MRKKNLIVLLGVALLSLLMIVPGLAQEGTETETFDNSDLPGWELSPEAVVTDGVLEVNSGHFGLRLGDWSDFDLRLKVRFSGEGEVAIGYHFRDEGRYVLHIRDQQIVLGREETEPFTDLAMAEVNESLTGQWLRSALFCRKDSIRST
jgi:hypothetical protein